MPHGRFYRIELGGDQDEASRWIAVGRAFANRLEDTEPGQPINRTYRLPHSKGAEAIVRMVIHITPSADDRWIYIYAEPPCEDLPGGFLSQRVEPFGSAWNVMHYPNGKKAIVGDEDDPRTADIQLSHQLLSALDRRFPHFFTGRMRVVVQCKYLTLQNEEPMPFMHNFNLCHGIYDPNPAPEPFDPEVVSNEDVDKLLETYVERQVWLIEIGEKGVFGFPVDWSGRCCDSVDYGYLLPTDDEIKEDSSRAFYKEQLSLHWAFAMGRDGVRKLLSQQEVQDIFVPYGPWYYGQCWAFSYSGRDAQNVGVRTSPAGTSYLTSRWRFHFTYDSQSDQLVATKVWEEADRVLTFWKVGSGGKSTLWTPDLTSPTFWDGVEPYNPITPQNAPIHVWYDGEAEKVMRYELVTFAAYDNLSPNWPAGGRLVWEKLQQPANCWNNGNGIESDCARPQHAVATRETAPGGYDFGFYMADGSADGRLRLQGGGVVYRTNTHTPLQILSTLTGKFTTLLSFSPVSETNPCGGNASITFDQFDRCHKFSVLTEVKTRTQDGKPMGALCHDREAAIFTQRDTHSWTNTENYSVGGYFAYAKLSTLYSKSVISPPDALINFLVDPQDCLTGGEGCYNGAVAGDDYTRYSSPWQQYWRLWLVGRKGLIYSQEVILSAGEDTPDTIAAFDNYNTSSKTRTQSAIILIQSGLQEQTNRLRDVNNDREFVTGYPALDGAALCFLGWQ